MKRSMFVLALLIAALVAGCQENSITDPATPASTTDGRLLRNVPGDIILPINVIALHGVMRGGSGFNSVVEIDGHVNYTTTIIPRDPAPPNPQYTVLVTLSLDASVRPFGLELPVWRVNDVSSDEIALEDLDGAVMLEKSYAIPGWSDGSALHIQFQVVSNRVTVTEMRIVVPEVGQVLDAD